MDSTDIADPMGMRPKGTKKELEARRMYAASLLEEGYGVREVARRVDVSPGAVSQWKATLETAGKEGLKAKRHPGSKPKLSHKDRKRLPSLLRKGPRAYGFATDLWTLERVAAVIEREFGVRYDPSQVWRILRALKWSSQKPERRAREQDEEAVERWRRKDWPRIKKARRGGRITVFLDESGFMLQPVLRRTWAPEGQTPILKCWDRRDRLSSISALTISSQRRRLGLYFDIQSENIHTDDVVRFLRALRRQMGRDMIVILDRLPAHRSAASHLERQSPGRFKFEWLPSYAPELNPAEGVWRHTKHGDLSNFVPKDVDDLFIHVAGSLENKKRNTTLLRSFFKKAGLSL